MTEQLENRLRGMTSSQLRGRYKRIFERLKDPIRMLVEDVMSGLPELVCDEAMSQFSDKWNCTRALLISQNNAAAEQAEDESADAESQDIQGSVYELVELELVGEIDSGSKSTVLETLSQHPGRLSRAREMTLQKVLVEAELKSRNEEIPDPTKQVLSLAPRGPKANPQAATSSDSEPELERESQTENLLLKLGEKAKGATQDLGGKLSEATKQVTESAAKASGKALWASVRSAFDYGSKASSSKPVPVKRQPNRRRHKAQSNAEELIGLIERLHELKNKGILSDEEFTKKKSELLDRL